ncbi:nuclear transport factor 2 family protein [Marilutibacter alkalisoli]|uniref:Nuclear transport factor 2 family protein n=1 Tax=Marilutibacter alkalisoli TaxID=2591633 RepID=A0A514BSE3_9GAMM|nr:nuclear transport factor 2 family protein [Lysobacter alkalisoli]QDH70300.1 nuclear transport factor 2 family protein [Lysobacter alkalisoli]
MSTIPYQSIWRLMLASAVALAYLAPAQADEADAAQSDSLAQRVNALDAELFAAFNACEVDRQMAMLEEDIEFYHDKGGLTRGRSGMERMTRERCASRQVQLRREIVEGSLKVYPVRDYGAIQEGMHRFYLTEQGGQEQLIEIARFVHVWEQGDTGWKIVRALSYDHRTP